MSSIIIQKWYYGLALRGCVNCENLHSQIFSNLTCYSSHSSHIIGGHSKTNLFRFTHLEVLKPTSETRLRSIMEFHVVTDAWKFIKFYPIQNREVGNTFSSGRGGVILNLSVRNCLSFKLRKEIRAKFILKNKRTHPNSFYQRLHFSFSI